MILSSTLSTLLILLPAWPAGIARAAANSRAPESSGASREFAPRAALASPLAPSLTATKVDSFPDPDGDGKAEPGSTITYTVTITNNGPDDATNVQFNDTVDPNTTLVPGSVQTQPVAAGDSYNVLGNVRIQPPAAQGLLANDCDPDNGGPCSSAGLTASGPTTSAQGGNVTVNPNGSFSYNPPAGFEGTDSFTYTVTDPTGQADTATATFTVNEVVWFVDNTAPAGGDGRLTSPFNGLAPLNGAGDPDEPSDFIFVHEGAGSYGGGLALENGQRLVGQGTGLDAALAAFGVTAPPHSDPRPAATSNPTLANAAGHVVTLADGNAVLSLNAAATAASSAAVFGSGAAGATTIANVGAGATGAASGLSLLNHAGTLSMTNSSVACSGTGTAVFINGGATALTFNNTDVSQNGGRVIDIQNRAGGAVLFDAASSVTGTNGLTDAVSLLSNTGGATVTFAGPVQLNTNAAGARGLVADSGGSFTLNLTSAGNAVSSTGGAAVDIENLTVVINFATTFSTNSNGRGLRVDNVSGAASFGNTAVNGSSNTGVLLTNNSASVTFSDLDIAPAPGARGLHATDNTGALSSTSGVLSTTGAAAVEIAGAAPANRTPLNMQLTSVSASGGPNGIFLSNTSATGSPGGFGVAGTGLACTQATPTCAGGQIQGTTGADGATAGTGVRLFNADSVALDEMRLNDHQNFAVYGNNVNGFTLSNSYVHGVNGTNAGGIAQEGSLSFDNLLGSAAITSSDIGGGKRDNVRVFNTSGTLDRLTISGTTVRFHDPATGNDAVHFEGSGAGTVMKLTVTGGNFRGARGDIIDALSQLGVTMDVVIRGNSFTNEQAGVVSGNSPITVQGTGTVTYDISCNRVQQTNAAGTVGTAQGHAINVAKSTAGGNFSGTIFNNLVGKAGVPSSGAGSAGTGIQLLFNGTGTHTSLVKNNVIRNYGESAIRVVGNNGNATGNVTVVGNVATEPHPIFTFAGLFADVGALGADTNTLNLKFGGAGAEENDFTDSEPFDFSDVFLSVNTAGAKINLSRGVSAASDVQQIITDNNVDPVFAFGSGTINFVNTVPALPAAVDQTCSAPVASHAPADSFMTPAGADVQLAATRPSASGLSAERDFAKTQPALRKIQRGLAHFEHAQVLAVGASDARPEAPQAAPAPASLATLAGETVSIPVGTLRAGDSVTITFQVTVADPFTGAQPQVSNQGAVTADGGVSVLTDDPSEPGGADPTVTPILLPPTVNINDATATEPATGATDALFTVTLSHPYSQPVTVNFATANGGANPATAGTDYTTTNGTVTFAAGETVQTVSVPVLADGDAGELDEHFLVNLSGATNGTVGDGQATGTITDESVASPVVISELRTSGPAGAGDDFVELLNATDADITVTSSDGSPGWSIVTSGSDCSTTPVVVAVIPNGTVIPARGNYLLKGSAYSLGAYAAGDATLAADIEDDRNVGLFTTANLAHLSSVNRLDAVGFGANTGNNCDLLREGSTLPPAAGSASEYSFVRKVSKGQTEDTGDNAADFVVVSTTPSTPVGGNTPVLGAPGPEGSNNPRGPVPCAAPAGSAKFGRELIDPAVGAASAPNVVRDATPDAVNNSTFGTLDFRRTFTNNTGGNVTALRFRVVDLSTFPAAAGAADLRARTSPAVVVATTAGNKTVLGTTLQQPPAQAEGGGVNSSLAAGTITLATPLTNGNSVNLRFLFGVEQTGDYDIALVLEASPGPSGKDFWKLSGHTEDGGHTDGGCNKPPVADAGADQTAECAGGQASVTLDGSASTDPDGDTPLTFEWSEGATPLGTGQTLGVTLPTGSHTITLTVTDPSGDSSQDTVIVNVVDTTAPVVNDPPDVTVSTGPNASSCGTVVSDAALGAATAADACEGGLAVNRTGVPAGNFFPVGTTQITYTATDAAGNTGTATQNVTVVDNTNPAVTPPPNVVAPADPNSCSATVNPGTATATDNCAVQSVVGTRSDNQPLNAPYPVGTTTITWTATDASGNTAAATQTVTVQDTQAPTLSSSVAVTTMGPPFNHALINVGLAATATDSCPGIGPFQVFVFSDEDDGTGTHSPDAFNLGLGTLRLRRERDGDADGRVYLVVVKVTDASGNTAASCSTVTVPLSNSAGNQSAVNAQAAAAASFCSANNGAAPAGYFVVGP